MNPFTQPKLSVLLVVAVVLVFLAASNPDSDDFREWYLEKHGLAGALVTVAVKRENRIFFSTYNLGGDGLLKKRTVARGFAGALFEVED